MRKISTKILLVLLAVCLISVIPISIVGINSIVQSSKNQAKDFGDKSAYYNAMIIKTWIDEKSKLILNIKEQLEDEDNLSVLKEDLYRFSEVNNDFISLFVGFEDYELIDAYGWQPPDNYNVLNRPWYIKATSQSDITATSVYQDKNKTRNVVAIATAIRLGDRNGVLAANIYADYLEDITSRIKYGEDGFVFLLDENQEIITGSLSQVNQMVFSSIISRMEKLEIDQSIDGTYEIKVGDVTYITSIANVEGSEWRLYLMAPISDFVAPAREMVTQFIYIILLIIFFIFMIDIYLSRTISAPIDALIRSVSNIAKGEFDESIEISGDDEIGGLGIELEKMRMNLKKIFGSIKYESKILSMNTKNLETHLKDTYKGTYNFMSLLSHDIKTPITLIKGYSKAIQMGIVDEKKEKEYIERIGYRANQIERITTDILDDTLDVNNINVKLKDLLVSDYITMVLYNSETYVKNQDRDFVIAIDYQDFHETDFIKMDIIKIQRVMNNILSNAVKFSSENSTIELRIFKEDKSIVTYFKDYGNGVKSDDKEKIFNMFYKSDEKKKGYGLGLFITKAIIDSHEGKIHFESSLGAWTESGYSLKLYSEK